MLDFRILGPLEVRDGGATVPVGGHKQRAVLAMLLLERGRVVPADRLIDRLWGDEPPRTAATSLQNFVSQLRKQLGSDVVETSPPGYRLRVEAGQLDLERFERAVAEARDATPELRAARLRDALSLWRGPALAEFRDEDWARLDALRLEDLRLAASADRLEAELEVGRHAGAVGELEALVAAHPRDERFRRLLMLALYRSDRQADALKVYHEARVALADEVGIDPSPALQQLYRSILTQEPQLDRRRPGGADVDTYVEVTKAMLAGRAVAVLGTEVAELAAALAARFEYPADDRSTLPRVAQYVALMQGAGPLYDELHAILLADVPPNPVHRFFAALPPLLRERGAPHQLLVTTSYDLALERAFLDAGEEFDVVSYLATGRNRGKFCHVRPDGSASLIDLPNTYATELSLDARTVILRVHGKVDSSSDRAWESFVITEDDYIEYLARTDVAGAVPVGLVAKLRRSHLLFLGFTMAEWNLRVVLSRLWGDQPLAYRSWAVRPDPTPLEREFWRQRGVDLVERPLDEYVSVLARHLGLETLAAPA